MIEGVKPSRAMGILLKEAERISINQQLTDQKQIIKFLKKLPEWP
jgi:hypothetical protein